MEWENLLYEYDQAKNQVFAQALANDGDDEATQTAWTHFCLTADKVRQEAEKVIAKLKSEVDTLSDVHEKWIAMAQQSDADNALINILNQEVFYWKQKLAAIDEIAVSYYNYVDEGTDDDDPFLPSEEQVVLIKEAEKRLVEKAYETYTALDAVEDQQNAVQADPEDLHGQATDFYATNWLIGQDLPDE